MSTLTLDIASLIPTLVEYAKTNLGLSYLDAIYAKNQLLDLFKVAEPLESKYNAKSSLQQDILTPMVDYAIYIGIITELESLRFETKIMGLVTPSPSIVNDKFYNLYNTDKVAATDYLNNLSFRNNYIRKIDIDKNIRWTTTGDKGDVVVTINLSKPEKDMKQVMAEKNAPKTKYPRCMLCEENLGFSGTLTHPARQTIRIIPITLNNEDWYIQFSPYVYYSNHCIAFSKDHHPMAVTPSSFARLLDFVELFPHYFMGSNADLPIVGGSILAHDHFQGGSQVLPMLKRGYRQVFTNTKYEDVTIGILDWYNSVVCLRSTSKKNILSVAALVLSNWREYTDESADILANTYAPHNTITPIAMFDTVSKEYVLQLILRNNRTDASHPDGIFHPTADMHNIKKEGIGLIEAMGIFILPGRLKSETESIKEILMGTNSDQLANITPEDGIYKHKDMINALVKLFGNQLSADKANQVITDYINQTCFKILECTAVFKNTAKGQEFFGKFVKSLDLC